MRPINDDTNPLPTQHFPTATFIEDADILLFAWMGCRGMPRAAAGAAVVVVVVVVVPTRVPCNIPEPQFDHCLQGGKCQ